MKTPKPTAVWHTEPLNNPDKHIIVRRACTYGSCLPYLSIHSNSRIAKCVGENLAKWLNNWPAKLHWLKDAQVNGHPVGDPILGPIQEWHYIDTITLRCGIRIKVLNPGPSNLLRRHTLQADIIRLIGQANSRK